MATSELLLYGPTKWSVVTSVTEAIATASKAGATDKQHFITGISFSTTAAATIPGLTVQVLSGSSVLDEFRIPTSFLEPIVVNYVPPLECAPGEAATISAPSFGTAIGSTVAIRGKTGMAR